MLDSFTVFVMVKYGLRLVPHLHTPHPLSLHSLCMQSIASLALLDSFSPLLLGVHSIEIDCFGPGFGTAERCEGVCRVSGTAGQQQQQRRHWSPCFVFIKAPPARCHRKLLHYKKNTVKSNATIWHLPLSTHTQLVVLTQYVHHPRRNQCPFDHIIWEESNWTFSSLILQWAHL